jgi:hypothetical protein
MVGGRRASASSCIYGLCPSPSRAGWRSPRAGGSSGRSRGLTALGLVVRLLPTHQAGGHGQAEAALRFHRTPRRSGRPGTVWVRPATRRATRRRTLHRGAPDRPVVSCAARVGLARPTKQVVDSPLGAVLAAGWHSNGLCGDLEQHIHDGNGNQIEFLTRYTPARWSSGRPRPCNNSAGWNVAPRSLTLPPRLVPTTLAALRGGVDPGSSCRPARS